MSLINNMLRKLDERQSAAAGGAPSGLAVPLESGGANRGPLIVVALVLLGAAAMGGAYWYLKPEPARLPTPIQFDAPTTAIAGSLPQAEMASQPSAEVAPQSLPVAQPVATESAASAPQVAASMPMTSLAASTPEAAPPPVRSPVISARAATASRAGVPVRRSPARPALQSAPLAAPPLPVIPVQASAPLAAPVEASQPVASSIHVERAAPTQRETHQISVQRALTLQQRGQHTEAEALLRQVMEEDRAMHPARSALASLLARTLREDEAHKLLEEGLAQYPGQALLTMQYARMLAARNAWRMAADVLARGGDDLGRDAQYHALYGAVLQRLGRFDVSVTAYQRALQLAGGVGTWWVGMAVSLESLGRPAEAREAYLQARARGGLSADVAQFVDSKLR